MNTHDLESDRDNLEEIISVGRAYTFPDVIRYPKSKDDDSRFEWTKRSSGMCKLIQIDIFRQKGLHDFSLYMELDPLNRNQ